MVEDFGLTDPTPASRQYRHGTLSAYTAGTCRCPDCRAAFASYRAGRRDSGLDHPRGTRPGPDTDGHLPRSHWRTQIWYPTCDIADLHPRPRSTTFGTPTPPGSSPAAPTYKPSANDSATNPSSPPRNTSTLGNFVQPPLKDCHRARTYANWVSLGFVRSRLLQGVRRFLARLQGGRRAFAGAPTCAEPLCLLGIRHDWLKCASRLQPNRGASNNAACGSHNSNSVSCMARGPAARLPKHPRIASEYWESASSRLTS
jgi:hypothetical protein